MVRKRKEELRMKTLRGVLIFIFLTGVILGATGPALLYGAETGGGNPWDTCANCWCFDSKAKGTRIEGTLTVYYKVRTVLPSGYDPYITLRLEDKKQLYVYREMGLPIGDVTNDTGPMLCDFIATVVQQLFPANTGWMLKSYTDPWGIYDPNDNSSRAFVTDITIAVHE
jgi:hypothetical protein